ncbi:MAG: F0F1 ATP synthase subunit delta [Sulfuricaulis sp.]|uniref:F0F1 ATP synthase subunit delta n=1 Tax=Sulfuricaulis sp. TaxID=2003553 RepID=UPI0034A1A16F
MAEKQTLARPYAEAVFDRAKESNALMPWSEMLVFLAAVAADENMMRLLGNPRVERARFLELFLSVCGQYINDDGANLVRLLLENRRLGLLPEIIAQFETRRAEAEARIEATVVTPFPLAARQMKTISESLRRKFGREVNLTTRTDKSLLGGIVIRAGDLVIDGSIRGRLAELATHLSH